MRQLHVLGVSEDGTTLLLGTSKSAKPTHRIPLDDRLMRAARGQLAVNGDRAESALTPKEYQARMRAGASPEEVAKAAGVPVARVLPYFAPVEAERDRIVDEARGAVMRRHRGQDGTRPLGQSVEAHLAAVAGLKAESVTWTARRRGDGAWIVAVSYAARGGRRTAEWLWQSADKALSPLDAAAGRLGIEPATGATKRRTAKNPARPAAKKATRKAGPRKAAAKKAAPARKATTAKRTATAKKAAPTKAASTKAAPAKRAASVTAAPIKAAPVKAAPVKAARVKAAPSAKKAGVRKVATGATRAAPVAKKTARKPAPVVKRAVRKPAPKPAVRKRTRPQVVTPAPAPAPVLEPVVELVPPPAPVERPAPQAPAPQAPAAQAPAAQAPAPQAPARKPGQRVPLPSWSEVLLGVTGKHDDGDQANGGGSGGRRAG